jgi:hypothetical protein
LLLIPTCSILSSSSLMTILASSLAVVLLKNGLSPIRSLLLSDYKIY